MQDIEVENTDISPIKDEVEKYLTAEALFKARDRKTRLLQARAERIGKRLFEFLKSPADDFTKGNMAEFYTGKDFGYFLVAVRRDDAACAAFIQSLQGKAENIPAVFQDIFRHCFATCPIEHFSQSFPESFQERVRQLLDDGVFDGIGKRDKFWDHGLFDQGRIIGSDGAADSFIAGPISRHDRALDETRKEYKTRLAGAPGIAKKRAQFMTRMAQKCGHSTKDIKHKIAEIDRRLHKGEIPEHIMSAVAIGVLAGIFSWLFKNFFSQYEFNAKVGSLIAGANVEIRPDPQMVSGKLRADPFNGVFELTEQNYQGKNHMRGGEEVFAAIQSHLASQPMGTPIVLYASEFRNLNDFTKDIRGVDWPWAFAAGAGSTGLSVAGCFLGQAIRRRSYAAMLVRER